MPASEPDPTPSVVIDTNVVLDWLLFGNPAVAPLAAAVESRRARWLASPRMRSELAATLTKTSLKRWNPDSERILTIFDRHVVPCREPTLPEVLALHCTDPDDQVFIDLALTESTRWLLTRDRALLKLARRAALRGLGIGTPERWPGP
jgi:uncharacterized protein